MPTPERVLRLRFPSTSPPPQIMRWRFSFCSPPYDVSDGGLAGAQVLAAAERVGRGTFLIVDPGNPDWGTALRGLGWVQDQVPWCELVRLIHLPSRDDADALILRDSRSGITAVRRGIAETPALARLIRGAIDPSAEAESCLRGMLPLMDPGRRARAAEILRAGFRATLHSEVLVRQRAGRDRRPFFRVGRALGAARILQHATREETPLSLAIRAGFASDSSLTSSLERIFGLRPWSIRGTVGWRWLLWLALVNDGMGRHLVPTRAKESP